MLNGVTSVQVMTVSIIITYKCRSNFTSARSTLTALTRTIARLSELRILLPGLFAKGFLDFVQELQLMQ